MSIKIISLMLNTSKPIEEDATKLRGYIANRFKEYPILHHHIKEVGYLYTYPKVQYKIMEGTAIILGIEEGGEVLKEIYDDVDELDLGKSKYKVESIQMNQMKADFGACRENRKYKFLTPWLALNPENYKKFKEKEGWKEKKEFLKTILIGNILSMSKGLDLVVDKKLYSYGYLEEEKVEYKGISVIGFKGEFEVNFNIPDLFGLGKGVSQGFGTVKKR